MSTTSEKQTCDQGQRPRERVPRPTSRSYHTTKAGRSKRTLNPLRPQMQDGVLRSFSTSTQAAPADAVACRLRFAQLPYRTDFVGLLSVGLMKLCGSAWSLCAPQRRWRNMTGDKPEQRTTHPADRVSAGRQCSGLVGLARRQCRSSARVGPMPADHTLPLSSQSRSSGYVMWRSSSAGRAGPACNVLQCVQVVQGVSSSVPPVCPVFVTYPQRDRPSTKYNQDSIKPLILSKADHSEETSIDAKNRRDSPRFDGVLMVFRSGPVKQRI